MAMRRGVLAGVVGIALALSSACATGADTTAPGPGAGNAAPATTAVPAKNDCTDAVAAAKSSGGLPVSSQGGILPADAHPASLLQCKPDIRAIPDQGQWTVIDTVRSTGSIDAFVEVLRTAYVKPPEAPPTGDNWGCPAIGYIAQPVTLVEADGTAYSVAIPFWGVCSAPDPDVTKALAAVPTTVVSTDLIRQVVSPGAQASGCAQQFAEMAFVTATQPGPWLSGSQRPFFIASDPEKAITACFYRLDDNADRVKPAGTFQSFATITGSQGAIIYDGLMNAPVVTASSCTDPAAEYAVVSPGGSVGEWSVVELTGCKLAASDNGSLRQPPQAVLDALLAARA